MISDSAGKLMVRMAQAGLLDEALSIAEELLAIRTKDPVDASGRARQLAIEAHIGEYEFERMLDDQFPVLVGRAPVRALRLVLHALDGALAAVGDQYWRIWLRSVRDARARDGIIPLLVAAIYEGLLTTAGKDLDAAGQLLADISQRPGPVMRRLELAVLGATTLGVDRLDELYRERSLFDDVEIYHEYAQTMAERWSDLTHETRERIRAWIRQGPTVDLREDGDRYAAYWRRRWLAVLQDVLPEDWKTEFGELLRLEAPAHPTHLSWTTVWSGSRSPKTAEEVAAMSNDDLITFLEAWIAPAEHGPEASVRGMANVLAAAIANDPGRFVANLERFRALKIPDYVSAIGEGLVQAVRNGQSIDWDQVLRHVEVLLGQLTETDSDDGTAWTAVRILEEAMTTGREAFPVDLRDRLFASIRLIAEHGRSVRTQAEKVDVARGIQTVRGTAMVTAIHYGLWVAGTVAPEATEKRLSGSLAELGVLLTQRIAPDAEPDSAIRAVLGIYFGSLMYLDAAWVASNLDRLLPAPTGDASIDAPWDAYLQFGSLQSKEVFELLASHYELAADLLAHGPIDQDRALNLGMHALIAYAREWDATGVVARLFFANAPVAVRERLIERVGHDLADHESLFSPAVLARLETLWRDRLANAGDPSELRGFGLWFASGRFEDTLSLDLLGKTLEATGGQLDSADDVAARLREMAPNHMSVALVRFERLLGALKNPWEATRLEPEGLALVRMGLAHADPDVVQAARRIRDQFGRLGFGSFGALS